MDKDQKQLYDTHVRTYKRQQYSSSDDVKKLILRDLRYKNTHFVNPELMLNLD